MLCPKCNAQNPAEARFCGKCGAALNTATPEISGTRDPQKAAALAVGSKKSGLPAPLIIAGVVVLLMMVSGVIGLFLLGAFRSSKAQTFPAPSAQPNSSYPQQNSSGVGTDAYYRQKVAGAWRARKFIQGAFVDMMCLFTPDGQAVWSGTVTYLGRQFFLMYSGTWEVANGEFHTRIELSNAPQLIPVGTVGGSKFISLNDQQWTYLDLNDNQTGTAFRLAGNGN
jgi:hypothetical protein